MSKVILVTGASSGLGQAIAQYLAARGHCVFGTSRSPQGDVGAVRMLALEGVEVGTPAGQMTFGF
ncbi:hypothetical protein D9M68_794930 [compost metagenome]